MQLEEKGSMLRKMVRNILIAIVIIAVLGGGAYLLLSQNKQAAQPSLSQPASEETKEVSPTNSSMSATTTPEEAKEAAITLTATGFNPATITIKAGTKVTWTNSSGATGNVSSDPHPIHTNYPPLNLGSFANNSSVSLTFDKAGTYGYHNHLNPGEKGTIIVQ